MGGADRYVTDAFIAQQTWTTVSKVIVADGEMNGIDALSAFYLARVSRTLRSR
ncbi:cell wall-binding repeat-containing protein [Kineococcus sp. R86509]|uniref:cell wall-binding repeat-containing protein n=1 Tax=Kineococcus sp. R86509 TaxID=3093851 RepID=UPI0036D27743